MVNSSVASAERLFLGLLFLVRLELGTAWLVGLVASLGFLSPQASGLLFWRQKMKKSDGVNANDKIGRRY